MGLSLQQSPRKMLLIDGIGAVITSFMLGVVLVQFNDYIGMPLNVLYLLATVVLGFAIYSCSAYALAKSGHKTLLKIIFTGNASYCLCTSVLIVIYREQLSPLGIVYFIGEILIISGLLVIEYRSFTSAD